MNEGFFLVIILQCKKWGGTRSDSEIRQFIDEWTPGVSLLVKTLSGQKNEENMGKWAKSKKGLDSLFGKTK